MARFECCMDPLSSLHQQKKVVRVEPPLAKLSGSVHGYINSFLASGFANSLGPYQARRDQARRNVGPDLDPKCLTH